MVREHDPLKSLFFDAQPNTVIRPPVDDSSPHQKAASNELLVLSALHLFGHMRRSDLMRLLWPGQTTQSANVSASRFFGKMERDKLISKKVNGLGSYSYVLTLKGARRLGPMLDTEVHDGNPIRSMQGSTLFHRTLATSWLVKRWNEGADVYGEYALGSNEQNFRQMDIARHYGKLPDGLVVTPVTHEDGTVTHHVDWLEVESSQKRATNLDAITRIVWKMGERFMNCEDVFLDRVCFLYSHDSTHESAILRAVQARMAIQPVENPEALFGDVRMIRAVISPPLNIHRFDDYSIYTLMRQAHML